MCRSHTRKFGPYLFCVHVVLWETRNLFLLFLKPSYQGMGVSMNPWANCDGRTTYRYKLWQKLVDHFDWSFGSHWSDVDPTKYNPRDSAEKVRVPRVLAMGRKWAIQTHLKNQWKDVVGVDRSTFTALLKHQHYHLSFMCPTVGTLKKVVNGF